ncbi:hypothetical protein D3C81_1848290 [compost metagenome]
MKIVIAAEIRLITAGSNVIMSVCPELMCQPLQSYHFYKRMISKIGQLTGYIPPLTGPNRQSPYKTEGKPLSG